MSTAPAPPAHTQVPKNEDLALTHTHTGGEEKKRRIAGKVVSPSMDHPNKCRRSLSVEVTTVTWQPATTNYKDKAPTLLLALASKLTS